MNSTETGSGNVEPGGAQVGLLGEYLKQRRLEKNFTLEKLSQKTKISVNILKCLEANDYSHLPSAAYIKGFVNSYAKVLGLPFDEAINKMEYTYLKVLNKPFPALNHTKQMRSQTQAPMSSPLGSSKKSAGVSPVTSAGTPAADGPSPDEVIESGDAIIKNPKSLIPFAILAVVIVLVVGGYKLVSTIVSNEVKGQKVKDHGPRIESSAALVKKEAPETPAPTTAAPGGENLGVEAPKEGLPTTAKGPETTPVVPAPVVEEKKPEPEFTRNYPPVEFKKVSGPLFGVVSDNGNGMEHLSPTAKEAMNPSLQNIYIKAVDGNTWLSYKIDTNPIESIIITKGNDLFLQGNEIRVFLGNVNVTKIFYNNNLISTPTRSGVKSLVFPESSNEKYKLPLFPKANDDILYTSEDYIKRMKMEEEELEKRKSRN